MAKSLTHEAIHDIDAKQRGVARDRTAFTVTETNAYHGTQAVAEGLGEHITDDQVAGAVILSVDIDMLNLQKSSSQ